MIDFNDFLFNFNETIRFISKEIEVDIDITHQKNKFNILDSQIRNKKWESIEFDLDSLLKSLRSSYETFKRELISNYESMY